MEGSENRNRTDADQFSTLRVTRDRGTQTDSKVQGHGPRLSEVNLFTLLSLWMELFPQEESDEDGRSPQIRGMGLVVVRDGKVVGLHCSGPELHAGQAAIIEHGPGLADCHLYFSRRPCATCLKMIINAGVSQISFWPGDPEVSMQIPSSANHSHSGPDCITEDAVLDALATEKLKSNGRPHICVLLKPLAPGLAQFVIESSRECDFMEIVSDDDEPGLNAEELYNRERRRKLKDFSSHFLVETSLQHRRILTQMGLENFCAEPYFSNMRNAMRELVEVLAAVAASVPQQHRYGFYREQHLTSELSPSKSSPSLSYEGLSQEEAHHCMVQAQLLAYRTEDPKVGVGAVIWGRGQAAGRGGTGSLYLIGCGYNAYPAGSQYAEYPQMDDKQKDRQRRKYRYIVHAEQNALTFRTRAMKPEDPAVLFVTKCPCDECIPLIRGAGITHIYTTEKDSGKDKGDISYLRFCSLKNIRKFIWQRHPSASSLRANGCVGKHSRQADVESHSNKKLCTDRSHSTNTVS
ncbi:uncharacterized protein V6R79_003707 [Siganus canaliculatus]